MLQAVRMVGASTRAFDLSRDLAALESAIHQVKDCRLVVIDPISAYLGGADSHKNADVRALLAPLSQLAADHAVAIIAVSHLNKAGLGPAIHRPMGSVAFVAAARAAWIVCEDRSNPDRRLLLSAKNNLACDHGGLAFQIRSGDGGAGSRVEWEPDAVMMTADEALGGSGIEGGVRNRRDRAVEWLTERLRDLPVPAQKVFAEAQALGFAKRTIERAKKEAGVIATRDGTLGTWSWSLTNEGCHQDEQDRQLSEVGGLAPEHIENHIENGKAATIGDVAVLRGGVGSAGGVGSHHPEGGGDCAVAP